MKTYSIQESQEDLSAFFTQVFDQQYQQTFHTPKDKSKNGQLTFFIKENEEVLAAMSCKRLYQAIKISDLAVSYSHQKEGLGSQLIDFIKSYAQKEQIETISLTTRSYQAKDFYLKHEFKIFGQVEDMPFKGITTYYLVYHL